MRVLKWLVIIVIGAIAQYVIYIGIALYRLPSVATLADRKLNLTIQGKVNR